MKKAIIFCLLTIATASAQQRETLAVFDSYIKIKNPETIDGIKMDHQTFADALRDRVIEIANQNLSEKHFIQLKSDYINEKIGGYSAYNDACQSGTCIGDLAKKANANYGARCDVFMFGDNNIALKFELYSVEEKRILKIFTKYDISGFNEMLSILNDSLPDAFKKMNPSTSRTIVQDTTIIDPPDTTYKPVLGKSYLVNLNTDPQGAIPNFNGMPIGSCGKTPCKVELLEGNTRIVAALEQYETADTTISIKQNNQIIDIKLKPNFGILKIEPAYKDYIGNNIRWNLIINGKSYYSFENRLSPGNYNVKLSHECYEDISLKVGINKGKDRPFNMASHIKLKMGGLVLKAEKDGEPVIKPVYINGKGKYKGETPFRDTVPVCSEISIGYSREKVNVKLKHNEKVEYTHKIKSDPYSPGAKKTVEDYSSESKENETIIGKALSFSFGMPVMLNSIDTLFYKVGYQISGNAELFIPKADFFGIGLNFNFGMYGIEKDAVREIHPDVDNLNIGSFINIGAFARLYPADFMYLHGGANFGDYGSYDGKTKSGDKIKGQGTSTVIFPLGIGLFFPSKNDCIFIEILYNVARLKNGYGGYLSFNFGQKADLKNFKKSGSKKN